MIRKPNLFIVGAPKCGTSFLYEYLDRHPEIFMCPVKEPNFFDTDLTYTSKRLSLEEYLDLYKKSGNAKIVGEASIFYLYSRTAAKEIVQFNPESKIIIMLRNPIEMISSLHGEHLFQGNEIEQDLQKALMLENERKSNRLVHPFTNPKESVYYVDIASYYEQVKRYFDLFGKENVKVILFEELKADSLKVVKEVFDFLSINNGLPDNVKVVNARKEVRSKILRQLFKEPPAFLKYVIKTVLPIKSWRRILQEKFISLNSKKARPQKLDEHTASKLKNELKPDIQSLETLLGKDLSTWIY